MLFLRWLFHLRTTECILACTRSDTAFQPKRTRAVARLGLSNLSAIIFLILRYYSYCNLRIIFSFFSLAVDGRLPAVPRPISIAFSLLIPCALYRAPPSSPTYQIGNLLSTFVLPPLKFKALKSGLIFKSTMKFWSRSNPLPMPYRVTFRLF